MKSKPNLPLIITLAAIKFILPFLLQSDVYELHRDEYLYYQQALHPSFGYLENPPLLPLLAWTTSWMGDHEWLLKGWASLIGSITLIVSCLITSELGGRRLAILITGIGLITGAFMRIHFLFQPNVTDILFWTLSFYFLIRFIKTSSEKYLIYTAIAFAAGFWSKYSIVFLLAAVCIAMMLSAHRMKFLHARIAKPAIVLVLSIIPVVIWQMTHNWPLLHHMQELQETQLQYIDPKVFLMEQVLMLLPVFIVWVAGLAWSITNRQYRFIAIAYVLLIIFLLLGRGKSYYSIGFYPVLIACGAIWWEKICKRKWLQVSLVAFILLLSIPLIPLLLPVWKPEKLASFYKKIGAEETGVLKWEDLQNHPLPQDFADMLGWKELSMRTEKFHNSLPDSIKNNTVIYARNYGQAGSMKFFGVEKTFTDKIICDNGTFLLWIPDTLPYRHLIFIGRNQPGSDDEVFNHFNEVFIVDSIRNSFAREYRTKIIFYQDADDSAFQIATRGLNEMKSRFGR